MKVRIKKLVPEAVIPSYGHATDACFDLTATSKKDDENGNIVYGIGLAIEIPLAHVGIIFPRSSSSKTQLIQSNSVSIIDFGYVGEIYLKYKRLADHPLTEYNPGDRIGQMMIIPVDHVYFEVVNELESSARGEGGFGSTGR